MMAYFVGSFVLYYVTLFNFKHLHAAGSLLESPGND